MDPAAVLAPAGILEVLQDQLHILFGTSRDTSDFVADALGLNPLLACHLFAET
jgi:hypothetical protein